MKKTFLRGGEVSERWQGWLPYWGFCSKNIRTSFKKHRHNLKYFASWRGRERLSQAVLKTARAERPSWVRIPPPPPVGNERVSSPATRARQPILESGVVNKPSVQTMAKIAKAFSASIEELIK